MSDEIEFVKCPACGEDSPDFGANVCCEHCGHAPMPYHDDDGELVES